jgi:hypothetical protein
MELGTILYNQKNHLILQMYVLGFSPIPVDSDFFTLINQRYEYFQHMVDNIRMETP